MTSTNYPMENSFWFRDVTINPNPLTTTLQVDVAIIGGGFAGLSTARYLKQAMPSLSIALIEAQHIGFGASGRNGGSLSLLPPITWLFRNLAHKEHLQTTKWTINFIQQASAELGQWLTEEKITCDWRADKEVFVGGNRFESAIVRWLSEKLSRLGVYTDQLNTSQLQAYVGYPARRGMLMDGYTIQPYQLARGIGDYLKRCGVQIYENTPINKIIHHEKGVDLYTQSGEKIFAEKVVIATNAYTRHIQLGHKLPKVTDAHTYMIATERLSADLQARIKYQDRFIIDPSLALTYARIFDDRLLIGGADRLSKATPEDDKHPNAYKKLHQIMLKRFPFLEDINIESAWGGAFQQAGDEAPIIQKLADAPNIILNIGYGGSGVAITQFSGRLVAGLVLGNTYKDPDADHLRQLYAESRLRWHHIGRTGLHLMRYWTTS